MVRRVFTFYLFICLTLLIFRSTSVLAHSEHDKARFVAAEGQDIGFCDNSLRPCKTIIYAVQHANKGDRILVAGGRYQINTSEELFYLQSEIVPILGGYNRFDHFQSQSPDSNLTFLSGIPVVMRAALSEKGFQVIADGKNTAVNNSQVVQQLTQKMTAFKTLHQSQAASTCISGVAAGFPCDNVDLVAHMPLSLLSSQPGSASDIWGHVDLNNGREYAIMGLLNGIVIVDISNPEKPVEVGTIAGSSSTWRDVKVYQFFDRQVNLWRAYAYATVDSSSEGVSIIDLNQLPEQVSLVKRSQVVGQAHNLYVSNVDHSLNIPLDSAQPSLQLVGTNRFAGSFHSYALTDPETIVMKPGQSSFQGYTHDATSVLITDGRKNSECVNGGENCTVFVDFNENEMVLWDITRPDDTHKLSQIGYNDVPLTHQYVHSGWVSEDKRYVYLHDEFDEYRGGLNSTVRIFSIESLINPVKIGQWTGPTRAIDHNGFVRGNRYYMSNYERGLTILDISDPANPQQVGYFDTFPMSDRASFNGAWGVYPFLPSGLVLVSDINSGLYILKPQVSHPVQGSFSFATSSVEVEQGGDIQLAVNRTGVAPAATSANVKYELISGSAVKGEDFVSSSGTLEWAGNETGSKQITVSIANDPGGAEFYEQFYVRLYDPASGATLTTPSYLTVNLKGRVDTGAIGFGAASVIIAENGHSASVRVSRSGSAKGLTSVSYQMQAVSATESEDFVSSTGTLSWEDGDSSSRLIPLVLINDEDKESNEVFNIVLTSLGESRLGVHSLIAVTIADDESNTNPDISMPESFQVNSGQTVKLTATVDDAENDELSFQWLQVSGPATTIVTSEQLTASFVAPSEATTLEFSLTATDIKAGQSTGRVQVTVIKPSSGGGGLPVVFVIMLLMMTIRRKLRIK